MTKLLVMSWNEVVQPDDTVYVLGDFAMGKIDETLPVALQLNGNKLLVPGNHDRCWNGHRRPKDVAKLPMWKERYETVGFTILPEQIRLPVNDENGGFEVTLCHFPPVGDSHDEDRYEFARPKDDGGIFLHGHVHGKSRGNDRFFDVGVDANDYRPVTLSELLV